MKREYKQPVAKFIDYAYEEQVVAESAIYNGFGDGNNTGYCTYQSGSIASPCTLMVNSSFSSNVCNAQPWSLR